MARRKALAARDAELSETIEHYTRHMNLKNSNGASYRPLCNFMLEQAMRDRAAIEGERELLNQLSLELSLGVAAV